MFDKPTKIKSIKGQKHLNKKKNHDIIVNVTKLLYFKRSNERERENNMEKQNAMQRLNELILQKNSRICAGLDPTWEMIPKVVKDKFFDDDSEDCKGKIFKEYCQEYIDAVKDVVPAIKINSAFFEAEGLENLYFTIAHEAKEAGLFVIGDVKRADIGSTSQAYAEAFLLDGPFDAITINPYFGTDGVMPFMKMAKENGKGVFVLVKTSNKSSCELQDLELKDGRKVYEAVADLVINWTEEVEECGDYDFMHDYSMVGAVVGATHPEQLEDLTGRMCNTFALVPGYGAQGATADDVVVAFGPHGLGAIINSSRGIMQAYKKDCWKDKYSEETWAEAAKAEAIRATEEINQALDAYNEKKER